MVRLIFCRAGSPRPAPAAGGCVAKLTYAPDPVGLSDAAGGAPFTMTVGLSGGCVAGQEITLVSTYNLPSNELDFQITSTERAQW